MLNKKSGADEARHVLRGAIQSGVYGVGDSLPSSRDLAQQFGINRNTANKIYRELASDGLVEAAPNRPPKVNAQASRSPATDLRGHIRNSVWPLLHEGRILGVPEDTMRDTILQLVDDFFYTFEAPRILVTECNQADVERYANELTALLGCLVEPTLLDQLNDSDVLNGADIVVTPHFHFAEAREALGDASDLALSVLLTPDPVDVSRVVTQVTQGPVGLVGGNPASVDRLRSLLRFYLDFPTIPATADDSEAIRHVIQDAEYIICAARFHDWLKGLAAEKKILPMHYHIDPISIELLRQRLVATQDLQPRSMAG